MPLPGLFLRWVPENLCRAKIEQSEPYQDSTRREWRDLPHDALQLILDSLVLGEHPRDVLRQYDEWCKSVAGLQGRVQHATGLWPSGKDWIGEMDNPCKQLIMRIIDEYGWAEPNTNLLAAWRAHMMDFNADSTNAQIVTEVLNTIQGIQSNIGVRTALGQMSLIQLRMFVECNAQLYAHVSDDDDRTILLFEWTSNTTGLVHFITDMRYKNYSYLRKATPGLSTTDQHIDTWDGDVSLWNPERLVDGTEMFKGALLFEGNGIERWTMRSLQKAENMFLLCFSLNADFSSWNPTKLENADRMFRSCTSLTGLGLSQWSLPALVNAESMFSDCPQLDADLDVSAWEPAKLQKATGMFTNCSLFKGVGLSRWAGGLTQLQYANAMFDGCRSLKLENLRDWNLPSVRYDELRYMLRGVPVAAQEDVAHLKTMKLNLSSRPPGTRVDEVVEHVFGQDGRSAHEMRLLDDVVRDWLAASA